MKPGFLRVFGSLLVAVFVTANMAKPRGMNISSLRAASSDSKDRLAIEPFRAETHTGFLTVLVTVPEGKLLVIESVTGEITSVGLNPDHIRLGGVTSSASGVAVVAPTYTRPSGSGTLALYTASVRLYVLPGQSLKSLFFG